jgi:hypothetical protein
MNRIAQGVCVLCGKPIEPDENFVTLVETIGVFRYSGTDRTSLMVNRPMHLDCIGWLGRPRPAQAQPESASPREGATTRHPWTGKEDPR